MAFLQSQPARQPIFRAPPVVLWLIGGLTLIHAALALVPESRARAIVYDYALVPARYSHRYLQTHMVDPGTAWERVIPFVSYMGLHGSWTHLIINCLWLLAFGPIVARRFGSLLFFLFVLVCGVAGACVYLALNWASPVPVVGASGAISGLMAAGLRMLPGQAPWAIPAQTPLAPIFSRQIQVFTAVWLALELLAGVTGMGMGGENALVAWQAHLGGFVTGLLLCGLFDRLRPRTVGLPLET